MQAANSAKGATPPATNPNGEAPGNSSDFDVQSPATDKLLEAKDQEIADLKELVAKANEKNLALTQELQDERKIFAEKDKVIATLKESLLEAVSEREVKVIQDERLVREFDGKRYVATQLGFWLPGDSTPTAVQELTDEHLKAYVNDPKYFSPV